MDERCRQPRGSRPEYPRLLTTPSSLRQYLRSCSDIGVRQRQRHSTRSPKRPPCDRGSQELRYRFTGLQAGVGDRPQGWTGRLAEVPAVRKCCENCQIDLFVGVFVHLRGDLDPEVSSFSFRRPPPFFRRVPPVDPFPSATRRNRAGQRDVTLLPRARYYASPGTRCFPGLMISADFPF